MEIDSTIKADTTMTFKPTQVQEDSDMDLETGKVRMLTRPPEPSKLVYKADPSTADYESFVRIIVTREAPLWDREKTQQNPDLFY